MAETWRIIDTGLRPAAQNIALNRALLEARRAEEIPGTLRFLRYTPCALIGSAQSPAQELNLDACQAAGIEIQRRLTGGDVMVLDERQISWELYLHRRDVGAAGLSEVSRRLCHAAATAVSALGVDARYRPLNDIEVNGRRISDGAGVSDGDALLFQGTLLVDCDASALARVSRLEAVAPGRAQDRVASLQELLGAKPDIALVRRFLAEAFESEFSVEFGEGDLTLSEQARYRAALVEIGHPDWVNLIAWPAAELPVLHAQCQTGGGRLQAAVAYDCRANVIRQARLASDAAVLPRRMLADLECALRDVPLDRLAHRVERFLTGRPAEPPVFGASEIIGVLQSAVGRLVPARMNEKDVR